jgi:hypothetical protein
MLVCSCGLPRFFLQCAVVMWTILQVELGGWAPVTRVTDVASLTQSQTKSLCTPLPIFFSCTIRFIYISFVSVSPNFYLSLPFITTYSHFVLPHCSPSFSFLLSSYFICSVFFWFSFIFILSLLCITFLLVCYLFFLSHYLSFLLPSFPLLVISFLSCYCPRYRE